MNKRGRRPGARRASAAVHSLERRVLLSAPYLVRDINSLGLSSDPNNPLVVGQTMYFTADDGAHGSELWSTDGTTDGTKMVADVVPGPNGSNPQQPVNIGNTVYFLAGDGGTGAALYRSDGTTAGTVAVKDFGANSRAHELIVSNGKLFFGAAPAGAAYELLWTSDGTAAGTRVLNSPSGSLPLDGEPFATMDGNLYVEANDPVNHLRELWKTDGTTSGTSMLHPMEEPPATILSPDFTRIGHTLFFVAQDLQHGTELWKSDGTAAGTMVAVDLSPGPDDTTIGDLTAAGGKLFFIASNFEHGRELYVTDGTSAGTHLALNIPQSTKNTVLSNIAVVGNSVLVYADDGIHGPEPWVTDGTAAGTVRLADSGQPIGSTLAAAATATLGTTSYFTPLFPASAQLWKTDGTAAGTQPVKAFPAPYLLTAQILGVMNGRMLLRVNDGYHGIELWQSDGTADGTVLLKDINPLLPVPTGSAGPYWFVKLDDGRVLFYANDGVKLDELWTSDGTSDGTNLVTDALDAAGATAGPLTRVGDRFYFTSVDGAHGFELWKTDLTHGSTGLVDDINQGFSSSDPTDLTAFGSDVYFCAHQEIGAPNGIFRAGLWKSDGTAAGTQFVAPTSSAPDGGMTALGGRLLIAYSGGLWSSDGTAGALQLVKQFDQPFVKIGSSLDGELYLSVSDQKGDLSVWKTDGTPAGTVLVKQLPPDAPATRAFDFTDLNGATYFVVDAHTQTVWKTDGTDAGTVPVAIPPDALDPQQSTDAGTYRLFLRQNPITFGADLWRTDGTPDGTAFIQTLKPPSGKLTQITLGTFSAGKLFFSADDGVHGQELWAMNIDSMLIGRAFNDANHNGVPDPGEAGLAGVTVFLDGNGNGIPDAGEPTAVSDAGGDYTFTGLAAGNYTVGQVAPTGYRRTSTSASVVVTEPVTSGPSFADAQAGSVPLDFSYLLTLAQHYGRAGTFIDGDANDDGKVDFADLLLVAQNYGHSLTAAAATPSWLRGLRHRPR